jgi:hypothetical protein
MQIVAESSQEIERRLEDVLRSSEFEILNGRWSFEEFSTEDFNARANHNALALVRDGDAWSQLVPATAVSSEPLLVCSFHFEPDVNNSGFVGWLATRIKAATGSGVAVICGQNAKRGGIFDYWCWPSAAGDQILALIQSMRQEKQR